MNTPTLILSQYRPGPSPTLILGVDDLVDRICRLAIRAKVESELEAVPEDHLKQLRSRALQIYQDAIERGLDQQEALELAEQEDRDKGPFILLWLAAAKAAWIYVYPRLAALHRVPGYAWDPVKDNVQEPEEPEEYDPEPRRQYLESALEGLQERTAELPDEEKEAAVVSRREAITYTETLTLIGEANFRAIKAAGYTHAKWMQLDRPTKRDSHELNTQLPPLPLGAMYPNGQRYPGDPAGGPGECINCLCWLWPMKRDSVAASLRTFDEAKHPRDPKGSPTGGRFTRQPYSVPGESHINMAALTRTGPSLGGSSPGAQYQDAEGNTWYVKTIDEKWAQREALAAMGVHFTKSKKDYI